MNEALWQVAEDVTRALTAHRAVVALETTVVTHGLPAPAGLQVARDMEAEVTGAGAVPATIGILDGRVRVGMSAGELERLAATPQVPKLNLSNFAAALVARGTGSTTVAATLLAAHHAGIGVFATGGIGGVHRGASVSFDVSSDIDELAATPVAVVSSGAKSILDLPATVELLETRRVPIIGYGVGELPAFYSTSAGIGLPHRVDGAEAAARAIARHFAIPGAGGLLIVQPPPAELAIPSDEMAGWIETATVAASANRISGGAVTPYVLARVAELSGGRTLRTNIGLIMNNARTASLIAVAMAGQTAASA